MAAKQTMSLTATVLAGVGVVALVAFAAVAAVATWLWFSTENDDIGIMGILADLVL